ncbi:MAG: phosphatidate cytidylyltransferase [Desulfosarcinaceae bacterium]|nr:phosphatidate cytidylyltransferase [Desulfosarcinaceae bacterium]
MHKQRWITGLIALPFIILLVYATAPIWFAACLCLVAVLALWEYFRILAASGTKPEFAAMTVVPYVAAPVMLLVAGMGRSTLIAPVISLAVILLALLSLRYFREDMGVVETLIKVAFSLVYIPLSLSCLVLLKFDPHGAAEIFFILCIVAGGDIGAYYTGSYLGKHKLCPAVSPNKTIEGSLGGLAANLLVGLIFNRLFLPDTPLWGCLIIAVLGGVAGQVGDLFESEFKRAAGVKDSGSILPGHGGMLDRIDALLLAAPLAYLLMRAIL